MFFFTFQQLQRKITYVTLGEHPFSTFFSHLAQVISKVHMMKTLIERYKAPT